MSLRLPSLSRPSSVTRWLLVVVGCAVLETAQPMNAADAPAETISPAAAPSAPGPLPGDLVLHPGGDPASPSSASARPAGSGVATWFFVALVGLGGGAAWWLRRRRASSAAGRPDGIQIETTRPLGNRQFLVVAACDGRRFLLGVSPGAINLLSPLDEDDAPEEPARAPRA